VDSNDLHVIFVAFIVLFFNFFVLGYVIIKAYIKRTDFYQNMRQKRRGMVERMSKKAMEFDHEDDEDYNEENAAPTPAEKTSLHLKAISRQLLTASNSASAAVVTLVSNPIFDIQRSNGSGDDKTELKKDNIDDDNDNSKL
jgi:hypothetical protein